MVQGLWLLWHHQYCPHWDSSDTHTHPVVALCHRVDRAVLLYLFGFLNERRTHIGLFLKCLGYVKGWALINFPCYPRPSQGSGHPSKFSHDWLAFSPAVPASILLPGLMAISLFPLCPPHPTSPCLRNSKGPVPPPFAQPLATDIFIDQSKSNWRQGPSAFGHADS